MFQSVLVLHGNFGKEFLNEVIDPYCVLVACFVQQTFARHLANSQQHETTKRNKRC